MKAIVLSYFDKKLGAPKILFKENFFYEDDSLDLLLSIMEFSSDVFFFYEIEKNLQSFNLIFEIPSEYGYQNCEKLMISFISHEIVIDIDILKALLVRFAEEFKKIDKAYKALYLEYSEYDGDAIKFELIKNFFNQFYEYFSNLRLIENKPLKVLLFGLSFSGKTSIVNVLQEIDNQNVIPTTNLDIFKISLNDILVITYDTPGQLKLWDLWETTLKKQDGIVYVIDVCNKENFDIARKGLHKIALKVELRKKPLLILLNKIDLKDVNIDYFYKILKIKRIQNKSIKIFKVSAKTKANVKEAFNWLVHKIQENTIGS